MQSCMLLLQAVFTYASLLEQAEDEVNNMRKLKKLFSAIRLFFAVTLLLLAMPGLAAVTVAGVTFDETAKVGF